MEGIYVLEEYADVINGGAWTEDEYSSDGIKVVKVTNMVGGTISGDNISYLPLSAFDKYKAHILYAGDLVLATVGSHPDQPNSVVGKTAIIPKEYDKAFLNQNAACIRVHDRSKVNPHFLKYITKTVLFKHHVESRARGSANQVRMAIGELKKFRCKFPFLSIQEKITAILSAYDDRIENNNRRIAILEKMAEELYREWFVRLHFPGHEKVKIVKGVPEGWEVKRFEEEIEKRTGYAFESKDYVNKGYRIIRTQDFAQTKYISLKNNVFISEEKAQYFLRFKLEYLDYLIVMVGASIGRLTTGSGL